ncbi:hypothetical protein BT69DRAFT_1353525 [Atractiella rhizophila]|nr:hypothetical protein BT69DRAFT_1353525 [Atractiella rhizophila]
MDCQMRCILLAFFSPFFSFIPLSMFIILPRSSSPLHIHIRNGFLIAAFTLFILSGWQAIRALKYTGYATDERPLLRKRRVRIDSSKTMQATLCSLAGFTFLCFGSGLALLPAAPCMAAVFAGLSLIPMGVGWSLRKEDWTQTDR